MAISEVRAIVERACARQDVLDACAKRDLGTVIAVLNAHGLTQGQIADLTDILQGRLSEYARRKRTPMAAATFEAFANGLGMPPAARQALGLAGTPSGSPGISLAHSRQEPDLNAALKYPGTPAQAAGNVSMLWRADLADQSVLERGLINPAAWNDASLHWLVDPASSPGSGADSLGGVRIGMSDVERFRATADPVVSRLVAALAADLPRALKAIRAARSAARERAWALSGDGAPGADKEPVIVDLDATIVTAHSEKEQAAPTWKKTFGFHPMTARADYGAGGNGEPLAIQLRPGNAGSNTAAGHIEATRLALAQLPRRLRGRVLVRADSGGGTRDFLTWLTARSRRLHYSAGMTITDDMQAAILKAPAGSWTPAYDGDGQVRDGAWVADITGLLDLSSWPAGMRVIIRKERPHPGAQLRFTDIDGHRFTAFATDAKRGQLADLELRHRRRARCKDRIRFLKGSLGLTAAKVRTPDQADRWVRLVMAACAQLLIARPLAADLRRPWEKPPDPSRPLTPGRVRRDFPTSAARSAPRHMSANQDAPGRDAPKAPPAARHLATPSRRKAANKHPGRRRPRSRRLKPKLSLALA